MATITSNGSGLWSVGATWVGGSVPVDNDTVVIATGHTVEFDVDQSGFANGIAGITVTGTLKLTRTAGTYYLKIKAAATIAGAGTFDCGTSGSIIPFAAKHTITGGAGWYINGAGGLTMTVYAAEPTIKTVLLTQNEAIGATVLHVDTDITGDIWADGDDIRIDDISGYGDTEPLIIAAGGRAAGTITVTTGLIAAKVVGAYLHLIRRNVRLIAAGTSTMIQGFLAGKLTIAGGEFRSVATAPVYCATANTISGGTFSSTLTGTNTGSGVTWQYGTITGGIFSGFYSGNSLTGSAISGGRFGGGRYALNGSSYISISGGVFYGCQYLLYGCIFPVISGGEFSYASSAAANVCAGIVITAGEFHHCNYGITISSTRISNANFHDNATADFQQSQFTAFYSILGSATENKSGATDGYQSLPREIYSESIDHDQVAGAYKAWTKGGVTSSQAVTVPTGYTQAMQTVLENAAVEGYWQKEYTVGAGASIKFTSNLRKHDSMTYLPRVQIFNKALTDPFAGGTPLHTFTMTDSIDTWESEVWAYTNSTAADVTLVVRTQGMHATATFYSAVKAEQINVDLTSVLANIATVDTVVDAIKVITDQIRFTVANQVDANALTGGGGATAVQVRQEIDANSSQLSGIKAKTDQLTFTVANQVDANALSGIGGASAVQIRQEIDSNSTQLSAIKAKTDNIPASPAAVGSAMTLTSAYDSAKNASSQASVNAIPTNPLLTTDARLNNLDATISSRLPTTSYESASSISDAVWDEAIAGHVNAGSTGASLSNLSGLVVGNNTKTYTLTLDDGVTPIEGAVVYVTTDSAGSAVVGYAITNSSGQATFTNLPSGTVYIWRSKYGYTFANPDTETV